MLLLNEHFLINNTQTLMSSEKLCLVKLFNGGDCSVSLTMKHVTA